MAASDKVNILVVDDLPDKLLVLETVLADLGQNVITVRSGEEALRLILAHPFAVILLDVNMPGLNGLETAALIRKRKKTAHVPIIFITAFTDEMHTAAGYSLGAVDYILSPVVPEILRSKVKVFVELFRMTEQVRRQADERVALIQEQAARSVAEEATRRSTFLAEASAALASSLDFEATVRNLARAVVPFLADLGAVTLVNEQGQPLSTDTAWVSANGDISTRLAVGRDALPAPLDDAIRQAIATGKTRLVPDLARKLPESLPLVNGNAIGPPLAFESAVVLPLRGRCKGGQWGAVPVSPCGALILGRGPSGRVFGPGDLALAEEVADRAAVALENARLYQDLQEADRRKNEFLSMLAHELRNPLAPIRNAVHVLRLRSLEPAETRWAQDVIDRQVQHLVRLVDDLLDISRITRGKIRLDFEPVETAVFVSRAVETSRPLIDSRRHQLFVDLPKEPLLVNGDLTRLSQILANLLNNAAKYTHEGGKIWVTGERDEEELVLRVRDTGIGIPAGMLTSVFDLFTQVDRSLDRSEGGLGIGLTLVRQLVEMHGGTVQAVSPGLNEGSEFVVRLPLLAAPQPVRPSASGPEPAEEKRRPFRVLVIDDNKDAAESLALLLRLAGHEVETALEGESALELVRVFRPQAVLLDIGLPGMNGYEVARRLRAEPDLAPLLLIALTGYGQEEDRRRSQEAGFDYHLVKPVEVQQLLALLTSETPQAEREYVQCRSSIARS